MNRRNFIKSSGVLGLATVVMSTGVLQYKRNTNQKLQTPVWGSDKPHTWWHWMNGNVTKEGITLDLESMVRVGIGGFQNFDAGTGIPKGPVVYLSPQWLELKKHAISEASRLGLEFTMHNCPGWSSSGGPWISPELSMQEVTWSELVVEGGKALKLKLPQPLTRLSTYQDIAVLAFKALPGETPVRRAIKKARTNSGEVALDLLTGETGAVVNVKPDAAANGFIEIEFAQPTVVEQVSFVTSAASSARGPVSFRVSDDGRVFRDVAVFEMAAGQGDFGFSSNVERLRTKFVRMECQHARNYSQIRFSETPRPDHWQQRSNFAFGRYGVDNVLTDLPAVQEVIDITSLRQADGTYQWTAPRGDWTILRFGYTPTGTYNRSAPDTGVGLECDKFNATALEFHFNKMMEKLLEFMEPLGKHGKAGLLIDSYEVGMQNWTPGFEQIFEKRNGYSLVSYLPALTGRVAVDEDTTDRFLWDFRRTQGDLMAENYYGKFTELCHAHQIISYTQPYDRGPMEEMQIGSRVDINVGEFWNNISAIFQNNRTMRRTVKLSAAIAHTNGQKIVAAESFTGEPESSRWQEHPFALKMLGDRMFTQGLNRMVFHRFAHQPHPTARPGMTMGPWGSHLDRTNTWWEQGRDWMEYLSRCQWLLQSGTFVADLVYYTGENAGVYTRVERNELRPAPPLGYDYDLINSETLLKAVVESNVLVLPSGMRYSILVLQDFGTMSLHVLRKVRELAMQGLLIIGDEPLRSPGLSDRDDAEFGNLTAELWSAGLIMNDTPEDALMQRGLGPDFSYSSRSGDAPVTWIHRRTEEWEIYFIANERRSFEDLVCSFRVTDRQPEIWDPVTGKMFPMRIFQMSEGRTILPLTLNPAGSTFVIFTRATTRSSSITFVDRDGEPLIRTSPFEESRILFPEIVNNFTLSFWAKPENNVMLSTSNYMDGQEPWTDFYAIYPVAGETMYGSGHSVAGLAVGRNGVAVWENSGGRPVFWFAAPWPVSGWAHIALRCSNGVPAVFINGQLISEGPASRRSVHPGGGHAFLHEGASFYNGDMIETNLVGEALSAAAILNLSQQRPSLINPTPGLVNAGDKLVLFDSGAYTIGDSTGQTSELIVNNEFPLELSSDWTVEFPQGSGAPPSITVAMLESLHLHPDAGVKYFSGTCTYNRKLTLPKKEKTLRYYLDLGTVEVIAEVLLNGKSLGTFWTRPILIDVTDQINKGDNTLSIKVTNLWPNRLIGDEQMPEPYKFAPGGGSSGFASLSGGAILELPDWYKANKPQPDNGRITFTTWKHYQKDSPLLQSGLIGPVVLKTASVYTIP